MKISWSKARTWRRCPKKYDYKYNQSLVTRKPKAPLLRGKIIGECLDEVVSGRDFELVLKSHEKEYRQLFIEEQEIYGDMIPEIRRIISGYRERYKDDGLKYLSFKEGRKRIKYEFPLEIELADNVEFVGYIDKMAEDSRGVWVIDHKSHKNLPDEDARFNDLQLVFYVGIAPLCGYPQPVGVCWDYLRTKPPTKPEVLKNGQLSQRQNIDTDYETYLATILEHGLNPDDYAEMLGNLKERPNKYYQRVFLPAPPKAMIENATNDLIETAWQIMDYGDRPSPVRVMQKDCSSMCEYYALCQAEFRGLDSDFIKKSQFTVRKDQNDSKEKTEDS